MNTYTGYIKISLVIFFITVFGFNAKSQEVFLSLKGGASDLYVLDGYNKQNWGTNWGFGAMYMIKDSVVGLEVQGLVHIMSGPEYNNDAFIIPALLKFNLDYNVLIQFECGAYYERFTRLTDNNPNASFSQSHDIGGIVGLNYMYPLSPKLLVGAEFDYLHGFNKPITATLPNTNAGSSGTVTGSYNLMFFLMNLQLVYHIGY